MVHLAKLVNDSPLTIISGGAIQRGNRLNGCTERVGRPQSHHGTRNRPITISTRTTNQPTTKLVRRSLLDDRVSVQVLVVVVVVVVVH
jgi:hypothetical protein